MYLCISRSVRARHLPSAGLVWGNDARLDLVKRRYLGTVFARTLTFWTNRAY